MPKRIRLSREDCKSLVHLLDNGFSLSDSMEILDERSTHVIFTAIREKLANGEAVVTFFGNYCPNDIQEYFTSFIRYMSFDQALSASISIVEKMEEEKKMIVKGMLYPVLLFIGVIAGIGIFAQFVLPSLISMMSGFHIDGSDYELMQKVILAGSRLFMIVLTVSIIIILVSLQKTNIVKTYRNVSRIRENAILVQYASSDFARFFLECERRGMSTSAILSVLKETKDKPLVAYIASEMDGHLLKGESFEEAVKACHVEKALLKFFRIAVYASDCTRMLEGYLDMVHLRTLAAIRRFSHCVQLVSYASVGIVLIFVYRVLMMPITMLQNI